MGVERRLLGLPSEKLGAGAVGVVYRTDYRLSDFAGPLVYKEILTTISDQHRQEARKAMRQTVELGRRLSGADRALLDQHAAWPREMVTDGGQEVGCLMPLVPQHFFADVTSRGKRETIPRGIEFLSSPEKALRNAGFAQDQIDDFSDLVMITAVLAKVVYAIGVLHKYGIVYGDISLKNAVFALNPPRVMLLDCDSVAPLADLTRRHMNSPFFDAPEFKPKGTHSHARGNPHFQDLRTDVYKLACLFVRGVSRGPGATQLRSADHLTGVLDDTTLRLLRAALDTDPGKRPSAKQLYSALVGFVRLKTAPPEIKEFFPATTVVPRGTDLEFVWQVEGAVRGRLIDPIGRSHDISLDQGRYSISAAVGGVHWLEVSTKSHTLRRPSVPVHVFDVPQFRMELGSLPQLSAPDPPPIPETVLRPLPSVPDLKVTADLNPDIGIKDLDLALGGVAERFTRTTDDVLGGEDGHPRLPLPPQLSEITDSLLTGEDGHPRLPLPPQLSVVTDSLLKGAEELDAALAAARANTTERMRHRAEAGLEQHIRAVAARVEAEYDAAELASAQLDSDGSSGEAEQ